MHLLDFEIGGGVDEETLLDRSPIVFDGEVVRRRFQGARVLVTGAGGSLGWKLCELLFESGVDALVCYEQHEPSLYRLGLHLAERHPDRQAVLRLGDVCQADRVARLVSTHGIDAVFHLAAHKQVPLAEDNCDQVVAVNVLAMLDLADAVAAAGARDFVYPSSDKAVQPRGIYGATKRLAELELLRRAADRRVAVARLVNVFLTAGNAVEVFARRIRAGKPLPLMHPGMTRFYVTAREATMLLASAAAAARLDAPLMLEVGAATSIVGLANRLSELMVGRPAAFEPRGFRPGERMHEQLIDPDERVEPSGMPGIVRVIADRPPRSGDQSAAVAELRRAVALEDQALARRALFDAVGATVAVS